MSNLNFDHLPVYRSPGETVNRLNTSIAHLENSLGAGTKTWKLDELCEDFRNSFVHKKVIYTQ